MHCHRNSEAQGIRDTPFKHVVTLSRPLGRLMDRRRRPGARPTQYAASLGGSLIRNLPIDIVGAGRAAAAVATGRDGGSKSTT
jgi:hypothetical protein